ncbi:hypothetical protein M4I21_05815 [Cellulophaga sp. 20_2_10]|uniref:EF-hand domain-containing protein n=1 Tax=Cellulophaga sp. 20_2_10 TaxID=2942476 RepID=UPI00201A9532|nr:EF-hand domain-containing protein [Cellulophaga sp. 20_2_10]MCL5245315.1 hypothetical protein [Cellulophaga sp. 20_2_10]
MKIVKITLVLCSLCFATSAIAQDKEAKTKKKFSRIDTNKDNAIDIAEITTFYKDKTNKKGEKIDAELLFLGLDADANNSITLQEFGQKVNWKAAKEKRKANKK